MKVSKELGTMDRKLQNSFYHVQQDILSLQNNQENILRRIERIEKVLVQGPNALKSFVGDSKTREVHENHCVFADGIEGANKVPFHSLKEARHFGFTECVCLH